MVEMILEGIRHHSHEQINLFICISIMDTILFLITRNDTGSFRHHLYHAVNRIMETIHPCHHQGQDQPFHDHHLTIIRDTEKCNFCGESLEFYDNVARSSLYRK